MRTNWLGLTVAVVLALWQGPAFAGDIRQQRVTFQPGATSATIEVSIKGDATVDYVLGARKGQYMNVSMATQHTATYFNILAPGENEVAMFNGSVGENQFEGTLPATGDYKIRVYMMRSAARRNESADYRLEVVIGGGAEKSGAADGKPAATSASARAGQGNFDATGMIPCAQAAGQPMAQCAFGVSREGSGTATVVVTKPDGRTRTLFFSEGTFSSAETAQADGDPAYSAKRQSDLSLIQVGSERYEIPDAVIFGG